MKKETQFDQILSEHNAKQNILMKYNANTKTEDNALVVTSKKNNLPLTSKTNYMAKNTSGGDDDSLAGLLIFLKRTYSFIGVISYTCLLLN